MSDTNETIDQETPDLPAEGESAEVVKTLEAAEPAEVVETPEVVEPAGAPDTGADAAGSEPADVLTLPEAPDAVLAEAVGAGLSWIPFAAYLGAWVALCVVSGVLLYPSAAAGEAARWVSVYVPLLWTGVGLVALGPALSLVVWAVARRRAEATSGLGLAASALSRGALVAFFGVILWVATLFVLDLVASGKLA